jgi:protein-tyrosine phosphatase
LLYRQRIGVLFVCMGNICRSPTAEGVFRTFAEREGLARRLRIDSAGTHDYHVGSRPDPRAIASALRRGYDIRKLRARQVEAKDFARFEWIVAMDKANLRHLEELRPADYGGHLGLLLEFAPHLELTDVPDPYYGGAERFERMLDLIEPASAALLARIAQTAGSQ